MVHAYVGLPAYAGTVMVTTLKSLLTDTVALAMRGDAVTIDDECGATDLPELRGSLAARFLQSNATHLVMIDTDVSWEDGALPYLLDRNVDFVAGIYPKRTFPISYPIRYLDKPTLEADPETGLLEVEAVAGGFVVVSRACIERMAAAYEHEAFVTAKFPGLLCLGLWEKLRVDPMGRLPEDFSFCKRWRDIGGKVWCDPRIHMGHCGLHNWSGRLSEHLQSGG